MIKVHTTYQLNEVECDDIDPWDYINVKSIEDLEEQLIDDAEPPIPEIFIDSGDLQKLWDAIVAARALP